MMIVYVPWERCFPWTENTFSLELNITKADYRSSKIGASFNWNICVHKIVIIVI